MAGPSPIADFCLGTHKDGRMNGKIHTGYVIRIWWESTSYLLADSGLVAYYEVERGSRDHSGQTPACTAKDIT